MCPCPCLRACVSVTPCLHASLTCHIMSRTRQSRRRATCKLSWIQACTLMKRTARKHAEPCRPLLPHCCASERYTSTLSSDLAEMDVREGEWRVKLSARHNCRNMFLWLPRHQCACHRGFCCNIVTT